MDEWNTTDTVKKISSWRETKNGDRFASDPPGKGRLPYVDSSRSYVQCSSYAHTPVIIRYDVCRCFSQGPEHTGEMEELANGNLAKNKTLPVVETKEEVSSLKAAESNLYMPKNQGRNDV